MSEESIVSYTELFELLESDGLLQNLLSTELQRAFQYVTPLEFSQKDLNTPITIPVLEYLLAEPTTVTFPLSYFITSLAEMVPTVYVQTGEGTFDLYEQQLRNVLKRLVAIGALHYLD